MFAKLELIKMRHIFSHPSDKKLYNLLDTDKPFETNRAVCDMLNPISKSFETSQRFSVSPIRFRVSLFNEEIVFGDNYP